MSSEGLIPHSCHLSVMSDPIQAQQILSAMTHSYLLIFSLMFLSRFVRCHLR